MKTTKFVQRIKAENKEEKRLAALRVTTRNLQLQRLKKEKVNGHTEVKTKAPRKPKAKKDSKPSK